MKYLLAGLVSFGLLMAYRVGYKQGLAASPEYAAAIAEKSRNDTSDEIERLTSLLATTPTFESCVPVMAGESVDEYEFCRSLLQAEDSRQYDSYSDREDFLR